MRPELRPGLEVVHHRRFARHGQDQFWAAHVTRYTIERWSKAGRLTDVLERDAPWFPPRVNLGPPPQEAPPAPRVVSVREDDAGRLWVLISVADANWRRSARKPNASGEYAVRPTDRDLMFDTVIEVIDPKTARVIATRRIPQEVGSFIGEGTTIATYREDQTGAPGFDIWRLSLASPR
jgi:hypothetical protein